MKDETGIFEKSGGEFDRYLESKKDEITVPKYIIKDLEKKREYYGTNDVRDIIDNYKTLSSTKYIPLSVFLWEFKRSISRIMMKPKSESLKKEIKYYESLTSLRKGLKHNLITSQIENVLLNNFEFIHGKYFEAVEFDVSDDSGKEIRGIFVYENNLENLQNKKAEKQLENIVGEGHKKRFDLVYSAMNENYKIKQNGETFPRGKRLLVHRIERNGLEDLKPSKKVAVPPEDVVLA